MMRFPRSRPGPPLLPRAVLTVACGAGEAPVASGAASAFRTTTEPTRSVVPTAPTAPVDRAGTAARACFARSAIEMIYVIRADGYEVARQPVGVVGGDGFGSVYVSAGDGARIRLTVDRGALTGENCAGTPVDGATGRVDRSRGRHCPVPHLRKCP
ncbi:MULTISPECIES: hypothetical protein [unclassified Streptomyces]|uniref:hypothetical protein n=1 Tax=unclassified Streptomyces TaxID=2593676 RepID=UPI0037FC72C7